MKYAKKAGYKRPAYKSFEYYLREKEYVSLDNLLFILDDIIILVDDTDT